MTEGANTSPLSFNINEKGVTLRIDNSSAKVQLTLTMDQIVSFFRDLWKALKET